MSRLLLILFAAASSVWAQTWCGKNYMEGSPVVPPGGEFPIPATSELPLLALRCAPAMKPYLVEDAAMPAAMLVDTTITNVEIVGAAPISIPEEGPLGFVVVTIKVDGLALTSGAVPLNATKFELPFSLADLTPRKETYDVTCSATYETTGSGPEIFTASASLAYLHSPSDGSSVVKMDARTGALLAQPATGKGGPYETVLPVGFYTIFEGYIANNLSLIDDAKARGYTIVSRRGARCLTPC